MHLTLIGGHGKIALLVAPLLAEHHRVTALIRNPAHADEVAATGATPRIEDVETLDVDAMAEVFSGSDLVVWSAGAGGGDPERTNAVDRDAAIRSIDAAQQAGVGRYLMVSYFGARPDHGVPADDPFSVYADAKAAADAHLRASTLDWTILGPSRLTDDQPTGRIQLTDDRSGGSGQVSRGNVAQVLAHVVEHPAPNRTLEFHDGDTAIEQALSEH